MNVTAAQLERGVFPDATMPSGRLWRAYWTEAKYETLRALRSPAFAIPFLLLPLVLYVLIGVFLVGSMTHGDGKVANTMFVNWAVFGVMGPGMFGFGLYVATEREQGLLRLKRALPMPTAAYLLAKMAMTMLFATIILGSLIVAAVTVGHLRLSVYQFLLVAIIDILGSLPFCAIGFFIGTRSSGKSAPAFVNLAYLPIMHLGGLFYPLPRSVQPIEFFSPAFYLDKLGLRILGAQSLDEMSFGVTGPSSHGGIWMCVAVLSGITLLFGVIAARRLRKRG
jgi:ABC-2 type transport system permease protein